MERFRPESNTFEEANKLPEVGESARVRRAPTEEEIKEAAKTGKVAEGKIEEGWSVLSVREEDEVVVVGKADPKHPNDTFVRREVPLNDFFKINYGKE